MEQNVNFQKNLEQIIKGIAESGRTPSLLLHSCCGPCSTSVLDVLTPYFQITVFFDNPNIDTKEEFDHRLSEQRRFLKEAYDDRIVLAAPDYDHEIYLKEIQGLEAEPEGGKRCAVCFRMRLERTLAYAKTHGFEYFGTTLTVSPHKNALLINQIGTALCQAKADDDFSQTPVLWLPSDFKKKDGYLKSIRFSEQYQLYRQDYCGCEFAKNGF